MVRVVGELVPVFHRPEGAGAVHHHGGLTMVEVANALLAYLIDEDTGEDEARIVAQAMLDKIAVLRLIGEA